METLEVGQVWRIKGLSNGRATIGRVEPFGAATAVHVSITCDTPQRYAPFLGPVLNIGHAPVSEEALRRSVDRLEGAGAAPAGAFEEGYEQWRSARGGVFSVTLAETVDIIAQAVSGGGAPT